MKIGIIDLNSGNLLSVISSIENLGHEAIVLKKPQSNFDALVMPGQGRFAFVASQLDQNNWREFIISWVTSGKKFIGICVGMQLLFDGSVEDTGAKGLGILAGTVQKLKHDKTPMVGWAKLSSTDKKLNDQFVYFVNSYAIIESNYCSATVNYGTSFCAAIQKDNIVAFQFHPEKSGEFGQELLQQCLN